jgi:tetratricopeptide (TPR) repeat protein
MASSTRTEFALCFCLSALCAGTALAQVPDAEARAAALEGKEAFESGDFEAAITHYEEARRLKPAAGLLFNLAQSHRHAGHPERAIFFFRAFLETAPPPEQVRAAEVALASLEAERRLALDRKRVATEKDRLLTAQRLASLTTNPVLPPVPPVTSRWWFWTIVGAATVGTAVAVSVAAAPRAAPTTLPDISAR